MGYTTVGELKEALPLLSRGETGLFGAYDLAIERIKLRPRLARNWQPKFYHGLPTAGDHFMKTSCNMHLRPETV